MIQLAIKRVERAIDVIRQGGMVILTDHEQRENEGDMVCAASMITPEKINFMLRQGSGIVCLALMAEQLEKLGLPLMVPEGQNTNPWKTPFTVSIEAARGVSTGVSASDRATTILTAIQKHVTPKDIVVPGHVFPLRAQEEGVLARRGHTEGAVDIVQLAGLSKMAVLCEIMNADGTMMRGKQLAAFATHYQLHQLSIEDIALYRIRHEQLIQTSVSACLPLKKYGSFKITVIQERRTGIEHIILHALHPNPCLPLLVRIHSACITGDLFESERCDCHAQLHYALQRLQGQGGYLIYLNQEGRGIGLFNKIKAYALQEAGLDTVEANQQLGLPIDARQYYIAAHILKKLKITHLRLLTNNPNKIDNLRQYSEAIVEQEKLPIFHSPYNQEYLRTKKDKLHHDIDLSE